MNTSMAAVGRWAQTALTMTLLVLGLTLLAGSAAGVRLLPVMTGSMAPYAPAGALVVTTRVAPTDVAVGDVVAFRPPWPYQVESGRPVFHRVNAIEATSTGAAMTTRGDANPAADPWMVSLAGADLARALVVLPVGGHLLAGGPLALALVLGGSVCLLVVGRAVGAHLLARRVRHLKPSQAPCPCTAEAEIIDATALNPLTSRSERVEVTQAAAVGEVIDLAATAVAVEDGVGTRGGAEPETSTGDSQVVAGTSAPPVSGLLPSPRVGPEVADFKTASQA